MCKKFIAFAVVALMVCFVAPSAWAQDGPPQPRPDASCTNCKLPITCNDTTLGTACDAAKDESQFSGCVNYTCSGSCTIKVTLTATGLVLGETYSLQTCNADEIGRGVAVGKQGNLTIVGQGDCVDLWQFSDGTTNNCNFIGPAVGTPPTWVLFKCVPFQDGLNCDTFGIGANPVYIGNTNDGGVGFSGYNIGTGISCPDECLDDG